MTHDLFLGLLPNIIWLIEKIRERISLRKYKKELAKILEEPLKNVQNSWDSFFSNYSLCFGAYWISILSEPSEPEMKAEEFFNKFKESYYQFLTDLRNLFRYIDAHKDEFQVVFSRKDWLVIQAFMKTFENEKPDWEFLLHHKKVKEEIAKKLGGKKRFMEALAKHFENFNEEAGVNFSISEYNLLNSEEFWREFPTLFKKHQKIGQY